MSPYLFIGLILIVFGIREWISIRHEKERKELYDRIMSADLEEFKTNQDINPPKGGGFLRKATREHEKYVKKLRGEE